MAERKQQRSVSWEVWDFPLRPGFLRELWLLRQAAGLSCANWSLVVVWPAMVPFGVSPVSQCESVTSHDIPQLSTTIHKSSSFSVDSSLFFDISMLKRLSNVYHVSNLRLHRKWDDTGQKRHWLPEFPELPRFFNHVFQCLATRRCMMGVVNGFFSIFVAVLAFIAQVTGPAGEIAGLNGGFFLGETSWCCHCHLWLPEGKFCDLCFTNSNPISVYIFPEYGDPFPSKFQWTFSGGHPELKNGCYVCKHSLQ